MRRKNDRGKTDSHEAEKLFDEESLGGSNLKSTIKKAQRKSLFRTVFISSLVTLFIIVGGFFAYPFLMQYQEQKAVNESGILGVEEYKSPNIHLTGPQTSYNGLFNGTVTFEQYKIIDGKPVDWGEKSVNYSLFGNVHEPYGDYSPIQLEQVKDSRSYDKETKQLLMEFYQPGVEYKKMINDFSRIDSMGENYAAEVALSFKKPLSPQRVRELLPEGVSLEWYWIYVSDQIEDYPISSSAPYIVGFEHRNDVKSETRFTKWINAVVKNKNMKSNSIIKEAYDSLKNGEGVVEEDGIKVMGVVVTGKPQDLMKTKEVSEVRTGVLGAVTNSY